MGVVETAIIHAQNIFLRFASDSGRLWDHSKCINSILGFSRFLDTLTLFGRFEILTPKIELKNRQTPLTAKNRKIDSSRPILGRFWHMGTQNAQKGISDQIQLTKR